MRELLLPYMDSCELEGVAVTGYLRGAGKLEVISPIRASFSCQVNPVSASGKGEGILVDSSECDPTVTHSLASNSISL